MSALCAMSGSVMPAACTEFTRQIGRQPDPSRSARSPPIANRGTLMYSPVCDLRSLSCNLGYVFKHALAESQIIHADRGIGHAVNIICRPVVLDTPVEFEAGDPLS